MSRNTPQTAVAVAEAPVKPYQGPPATPDNFTEAYKEFDIPKGQVEAAGGGRLVTGTPVRGLRPLDTDSQRRLDQFWRQIRMNRPAPATVINLHPWELFFISTNPFLRGIRVPPCQPGEPFAYHHIRTVSADKSYKEDGTFEFAAVLPIQKACQFLVAFADPETYGGGVLVYEGDQHPNNMKQVETYGPNGSLNVTKVNGYEEGDEGEKIPVVIDHPIRRDLHEMITQQRLLRNEHYLRQMDVANELYGSKEPKARREVTKSPKYKLMARMLDSEGLLPKECETWALLAPGTEPVQEPAVPVELCKRCGAALTGGYACGACNNIIDPLAAYMDFAIEFEHAKMASLDTGQRKEAQTEKERREKAAAKA